MKVATWNINECVGITCNLDNQKTEFDYPESYKPLEELTKKYNIKGK